jgi:hypothetical protein
VNPGDPDANQPYWSANAGAMGGGEYSTFQKSHWWVIAIWPCNQDGDWFYALRENGETKALGYAGGDDAQVIVAYRRSGIWTTLYNQTLSNGAQVQVGTGAGEINNGRFRMDTGDQIRIVMRIHDKWGMLNTDGLDFKCAAPLGTVFRFR